MTQLPVSDVLDDTFIDSLKLKNRMNKSGIRDADIFTKQLDGHSLRVLSVHRPPNTAIVHHQKTVSRIRRRHKKSSLWGYLLSLQAASHLIHTLTHESSVKSCVCRPDPASFPLPIPSCRCTNFVRTIGRRSSACHVQYQYAQEDCTHIGGLASA